MSSSTAFKVQSTSSFTGLPSEDVVVAEGQGVADCPRLRASLGRSSHLDSVSAGLDQQLSSRCYPATGGHAGTYCEAVNQFFR